MGCGWAEGFWGGDRAEQLTGTGGRGVGPVDAHDGDIDAGCLERDSPVPSNEPAMGAAFSGLRETATVTCCAPVMTPEVGSKPFHPAPGR